MDHKLVDHYIKHLTLRLFSVALPLLAIGAAFDAQNLNVGFFNRINFSYWVEFLLVILILDFAIWLQHLLTHKIGFYGASTEFIILILKWMYRLPFAFIQSK